MPKSFRKRPGPEETSVSASGNTPWGAIMTGMYLHGGVRPFGGTFLVFADYMRPAIRVAALMKLPMIYVFTHDSVAVGEDGPTHQPVEHVASPARHPRTYCYPSGRCQ